MVATSCGNCNSTLGSATVYWARRKEICAQWVGSNICFGMVVYGGIPLVYHWWYTVVVHGGAIRLLYSGIKGKQSQASDQLFFILIPRCFSASFCSMVVTIRS